MRVMGLVLTLLVTVTGCDENGSSSGDAHPDGGEADDTSTTSDGEQRSGKWSMGYYAGWKADQYPIEAIEWSGLTHIAMSFYLPDGEGTLRLLGGNPDVAAALVEAAHANGVVPVASIGGADSESGFQAATSTETIDTFVSNLAALIDDGYGGIDIDWEPMAASDQTVAADLADRIRAERPGVLMTIPIGTLNVNLGSDLAGFSAIADAYDQLNVMSYGMAGAWEGWQSWHSSPLYHRQASTPMSVDSTVSLYLDAGVPSEKLGVGIGFYGLCYGPPVTGPEQALDGSTVLASDSVMSYANIMTDYYTEDADHFDDFARVPYLSFDAPTGPTGCTFVSYDDPRSIQEKSDYINENNLGGVIMWELNEGFLPDAPPGEGNPLLIAIRDSVLSL